MHELSIAEAILDAVRAEAEKHPGERVAKVVVRVGAVSGVEPDALSFGFECLVEGTDLAPLALVIERVPRRQRCAACDLTFDVPDGSLDALPSEGGSRNAEMADLGLPGAEFSLPLACPRCGQAETTLAGGDQLELAYLEIE